MIVTLLAATTLNGKIAHTHHEPVTWTSKEDKEAFAFLTKKSGVIIMGHNTFKTFHTPLLGRLHVVYTHNQQLLAKKETHTILYTDKAPGEVLLLLKEKGYTDIYIIGGRDIYTLYLKANLINYLHLTIEPVLFGKGIALFQDMRVNTNFSIHEVIRLNNNTITLIYKAIQ